MGHLECVSHNYQDSPLRRLGRCSYFCFADEDTDIQLERILKITQLIEGKIKPRIPKS